MYIANSMDLDQTAPLGAHSVGFAMVTQPILEFISRQLFQTKTFGSTCPAKYMSIYCNMLEGRL